MSAAPGLEPYLPMICYTPSRWLTRKNKGSAMEEKLSRRLALMLLNANSSDEVKHALADDEARYYFDMPANWTPYGGREKNWDTVGNQQSNPVGALVEIIINGEDAILLRKAAECGIADPRGNGSPRSMFDAVKRFFPHVNEGKIQKLSAKERTVLAEECIRIGVKRANRSNGRFPTYVVVDSGCGQRPENFASTFLSLGEKNKEGIPFVQGKFNMGSTGSLRFCTRSNIRDHHYKLILSKAPGCEYWGWTLVRVRAPKGGEQLPVAEYFSPGGNVPMFREPSIRAFFGSEDAGITRSGSIVKLYEYDIGDKGYQVDIGLYNALTVNLIDCALPIRVYDFDAKSVEGKGLLRKKGIAARTFSGLNVVLGATLLGEIDDSGELREESDNDTEWVQQIAERNDEELGKVRIIATGVRKLKEFLEKQPARVFYTINGQTHAYERASFLNQRVALPDLRNHLLVNVVCDDLDKEALATIFMPDRERRAANELSKRLETIVIEELKDDPKLRQYAAEIRTRRAHEHVADNEATRELLQELVKSDPAIRDLFGLGAFLPKGAGGYGVEGNGASHRGGSELFVGKKFPTFLKLLNVRQEDGRYIKDVPINARRRIECGTDAENEYLTRADSPGLIWLSLPGNLLQTSVKLHNGVARFSVWATSKAVIGDEVEAEFGFTDMGENIDPLKVSVTIRFVAAEAHEAGKAGKRGGVAANSKAEGAGQPEFVFVAREGWSDHGFDDDAGAYYAQGDEPKVYVNRDNRYLVDMRVRERDEATRVTNENVFRLALGLSALAIFRKASVAERGDGEGGLTSDPDAATRMATSALAPYIVTIVRRLGGN